MKKYIILRTSSLKLRDNGIYILPYYFKLVSTRGTYCTVKYSSFMNFNYMKFSK